MTADISYLQSLFHYVPQDGALIWNERPEAHFRKPAKRTPKAKAANWNSRHAGRVAGVLDKQTGYRKIGIDGKLYYAHRVVWALHFGHWPQGDIDHSNGLRSDNRIENLRSVSRSENCTNKGLAASSKSGCHGVFWVEKTQKWAVQNKKKLSNKMLGQLLEP